MHFTIDGRVYRLEFSHYTNHYVANGKETPPPGTDCFIYEGAIEAPIAVGQAFLSENDRFCKETGRKVSLTRALAKWPREHRAIVWEAYFSRRTK